MAKEWKTERKVSVLIAVSQLTKDGSHSSVYVGISDSFPLGYFPDYSKERTQPGAFEPQEPPLLTYSWTSPPGPQPATRPGSKPFPAGSGLRSPGAAFHLLPPANANSFGAATSFSPGVTCANACKTPGPCCPGQRHTVLLAWPCLQCLKLQAPRLVFFFANNGLTSPFF